MGIQAMAAARLPLPLAMLYCNMAAQRGGMVTEWTRGETYNAETGPQHTRAIFEKIREKMG